MDLMEKRLRECMDEETETLIREALKRECIEVVPYFGELRLVSETGRRVFIDDTIAYVDDLNTGCEEDYDLIWCGIIKPD